MIKQNYPITDLAQPMKHNSIGTSTEFPFLFGISKYYFISEKKLSNLYNMNIVK